MKKLLLAFSMLCLIGGTYAQTLNQAANWPNVSWSVTGTYNATYLYDDPTASANFHFDDDDAGSSSLNDVAAESPIIDLTSAHTAGETILTVEYDYAYNEVTGDFLQLEYYDAGTSLWVLWEGLPENSGATASWCGSIATPVVTSVELDISGFSGTQLSGFRYRFLFDDGNQFAWGFCISSPTISSASPPCYDPSSLAASSITSSGAQLGWTENGSATAWDLYISTVNTDPLAATPPTVNDTTNPDTWSDGLSNTTYYAWVRSDCGMDNSSDISAWIGPVSFTTLAGCGSMNVTYCYDNNDQIVGTYTAINVGDYVTIDINAGFFEATYDFLEIYEGVGTGGTLLFSSDGDVTGQSITSTTGTLTVFVDADGSFSCQSEGYTELDFNIVCTAPPSCPDPSALVASSITAVGADLAWMENGTATAWDLYISAVNTDPLAATPPTVNDTTNPDTWAGGLASTTYYAWVRADCAMDNSDVSEWIGPVSFTTLASCPDPSGLAASGITTSGADLDWTENGSATVWDLYISTVNTDPLAATPPTVNDTTNPDTWSDGMGSTTYYAWVRSDCGMDNTSDISNWVGPVSFTTLVAPLSNPSACGLGLAIPDDSCTAAHEFDINVTSAPGSNLGTDVLLTDVKIIIDHTFTGDLDITLISPDNTSIILSTDNGGGGDDYGDPTDGTCMDVTDFNMDAATAITAGSAPFIGTYVPEGDFGDFDGTDPVGLWTIQICDDAGGDVGTLEYVELVFAAPPTCPNPSALAASSITAVGADLAWMENGTATAWDLYISAVNTDPLAATPPTVNDTTNPDTWAGGLANTTYYAWVRADCAMDNNDVSEWIGPVSFTTLASCPDPSGLAASSITTSGADLDWTENGPATVWDLYISTVNTDPLAATSPTVNDTTNPDTWSDGIGSTTYYAWVRSDCGMDNTSDISNWVGPVSFTTLPETCSTTGVLTNCSPAHTRYNGTAGGHYFYDSYSFTVPTDGNYAIQADWTGMDGYLVLYSGSFDPSSPLTNYVFHDDDFISTASSRIESVALTTGTTYIVVGTSFDQNDLGSGAFVIEGPGEAICPGTSSVNGVAQGAAGSLHESGLLIADRECTDVNGWTHYYDDGGTATAYANDVLLLSLKKNGNDIGTIGDLSFSLEVESAAGTSNLGTDGCGAPYATQPEWYVMLRTWDVSPTDQPTSDVDVRFYYLNSQFASVDAALTDIDGVEDLTFYKIENGKEESLGSNPCHAGVGIADYNEFDPGEWTAGVFGSDHYAEYSVGGFSGGGGGGGTNAEGALLPVSLVSFDGAAMPQHNKLYWTTDSEENAELFLIERSANGHSRWETVAIENAVGFSTTIQNYSTVDDKPIQSAYYRLKAVDFDGTFGYSNIIRIERKAESGGMTVYPVPAKEQITINFDGVQSGAASIIITDMTGRQLLQQSFVTTEGLQTETLELDQLQSGVFLLILETNGERFVQRIVKQ